jgi:hypothetical protein
MRWSRSGSGVLKVRSARVGLNHVDLRRAVIGCSEKNVSFIVSNEPGLASA